MPRSLGFTHGKSGFHPRIFLDIAVGAFTKPRGLECQGQTLTGNVAAVRSQPVSGVTVAEEGFGGAAGNVRMT